MLVVLLLTAVTNVDAAMTSPGSTTACVAESPEIGSLLQREFTEFADTESTGEFTEFERTEESASAESTESRASASDLLYLSSVGMDLGASLSPAPWELVELGAEHLFTSLNVSKTLGPQMHKTFDLMAQKMQLGKKYTAKELATFKSNFAQAVTHDAQVRLKKTGARKISWLELSTFVKQELLLQQPLTTEKITKDVNRRGLGWTAGHHSEVGKLTLQDFENSLGYRHSSNAPIDSKPPKSEQVVLLGDGNDGPPENFDARTGWPECAKIVGLVPNQGKCASCWALTTVGVMNDRLCISSGGVFNSQLSSADVLACSKKNFGCKGGNPAWAVEHLQQVGTVTGGDFLKRGLGESCFPYPVKQIDATKHFESQVETPECRSYCPDLLYPREYSKDKYIAAGRAYLIGGKWPHKNPRQAKDTWNSLTKIMSTKGSVMMMYAVGRTHIAYEAGFWDCPAGQPNHMVRCIGYGVDEKYGKYITCVQSWGESWGEEGRFRMQYPGNGCLEMFMSIPVNWVGKNMRTGVPPSRIRSMWQSFKDWWSENWR